MSHIDKRVTKKINVFEFVKSHRVKENGQSTFVSQLYQCSCQTKAQMSLLQLVYLLSLQVTVH